MAWSYSQYRCEYVYQVDEDNPLGLMGKVHHSKKYWTIWVENPTGLRVTPIRIITPTIELNTLYGKVEELLLKTILMYRNRKP